MFSALTQLHRFCPILWFFIQLMHTDRQMMFLKDFLSSHFSVIVNRTIHWHSECHHAELQLEFIGRKTFEDTIHLFTYIVRKPVGNFMPMSLFFNVFKHMIFPLYV